MFILKQFPQHWIFVDRSSVRTGPFGLPIAICALIWTFIISILFCVIWSLESFVLINVIGFTIPFPVKVLSSISTLILFAFLLNGTGGFCLVMLSSFVYFVTHTALLGGLLKFFFKYREFERPLYRMLFMKSEYGLFYFFLSLCFLRILACFPYMYYVLVLFSIRVSGGSGWERKSAYEYDSTSIPEHIDTLKERYKYIMKKLEMLNPPENQES